MKNILLKIIAVFLGLLVFLVPVEIYLRFIKPYQVAYQDTKTRVLPVFGFTQGRHTSFDKTYGHRLIANIRDDEARITTGEYGDRTTGKIFDPNLKSIAFVGDSIVFGWGVGDEDSFIYLLAQDQMFKNYNFFNLGVPSYNPAQIAEVLKSHPVMDKVDIIVVGLLWPFAPALELETFKNGSWEKIDFEFYRKLIPERDTYTPDTGTTSYIPKFYVAAADLFKYLSYQNQIKTYLSRPTTGIGLNFAPQESMVEIGEKVSQLFVDATEHLRKKGKRVVFYLHPYQFVVQDTELDKKFEILKSTAIAKLNALDLTETLRANELKNPGTIYFDTCHLSTVGHQVEAEFFRQYLIDKQNL